MKNLTKLICFIYFFAVMIFSAKSQDKKTPVLLNEMTWVEVQSYLETNDMVIIPLGSTEQHGKHLPVGTDYFAASELSKRISAETGVLIASILMVGYSEYHNGFPGTMSISPETMEQVIFESIQSLMKHGFKRFMFFNGHGGNNIAQDNLIHRINHTTGAIAVSIGVGSSLWNISRGDSFDMHAGVFETSLDLALFPELVQMDKAEKPTIHLSEEVQKMMELSKNNTDLYRIWQSSMFVPEGTGKGGAVHEVSSNGVISFSDPKDASKEQGEEYVNEIVSKVVAFIEGWKAAE